MKRNQTRTYPATTGQPSYCLPLPSGPATARPPTDFRQAVRARTHACPVSSSSASHREPRAPALPPLLSSPAFPCSRPPLIPCGHAAATPLFLLCFS